MTSEGSKAVGIGTGTLIGIANRVFVATAGHVIKDQSRDSIAVIPFDHTTEERLPIIEARLHRNLDLAWIEVDRQRVERSGAVAVPLEQLAPGIDHLPNDIIGLYGYPEQLVLRAADDPSLVGIVPMSFTSMTVPPSDWPSEENALKARDLSPTTDIAIDYPEGDSVGGDPYGRDLPRPEGVSGGGIWTMGCNPRGVWSPADAHLIGIDRGWRKDFKLVFGTQIQHWLDFVALHSPELATEIRTFLGDRS